MFWLRFGCCVTLFVSLTNSHSVYSRNLNEEHFSYMSDIYASPPSDLVKCRLYLNVKLARVIFISQLRLMCVYSILSFILIVVDS